MKQVLVKSGAIEIKDVPPPGLGSGMALVKVSHSLISSGTESGFVSGGGAAGFVFKKAKDPLNVEKLKRRLASTGVRSTIEAVKSKLFEYQAPGYSSAGVIVECAPDLAGFRPGDRVACAGVGYASHAEYNAVPQALLTPIPDGVGFEDAAFVALGAIAMQGVRRAEPVFGETVVVLGLGLVGQLAAQIARAAGCHVIGCDPVDAKRALATALGAQAVCTPEALNDAVAEWTAGQGADAVIVCAASKESAVANQAIELCRVRGRVSVVGAVGMRLEREALYMKEVDFRLSCSYGPGRYNANYEEKGLDYPYGFVRWTEGRNMAEFLRMIAEGKVKTRPLATYIKSVEEAQQAYDAVLGGGEAIAALLKYADMDMDHPPAAPPRRVVALRATVPDAGKTGFAVIGAGALAQAFHLPNIGSIPGATLVAVCDAKSGTARQAGDRFGATYCTTDYRDVLADEAVRGVIVATRHHLHREIAVAALESGKHVFVEKPLALTVQDCEEICAAAQRKKGLLTVGFNRRFSPYAREAKKAMDAVAGPKMLLYRCNAGPLPPGHWALDPVEGGGRILGEAVHFIDFACWMLGADPVAVEANALAGEESHLVPADNLSIVLRFPCGSLATIVYCAIGHPGMDKERIEGFAHGGSFVIDDYRSVTLHGLPGKSARGRGMDKGMRGILENFAGAVRGATDLEITGEDGLRATRLAIAALKAAGAR